METMIRVIFAFDSGDGTVLDEGRMADVAADATERLRLQGVDDFEFEGCPRGSIDIYINAAHADTLIPKLTAAAAEGGDESALELVDTMVEA